MAWMRPVTEKQAKFVEAYLTNGRNLVLAYRAAFDAHGTENNDRRNATQLLNKPHVLDYIRRVETSWQAAGGQSELPPRVVPKPPKLPRKPLPEVVAPASGKAVEAAAEGHRQATMASLGVMAEALPSDATSAEDCLAPPHQPAATLPSLSEVRLPVSVAIVKHTREWFLALLETQVARCMQIEPVRDMKGNPTGEFVHRPADANKAIELMAKITGVLVDKREITHRLLNDMTEAELRQRREELRRRIAEENGEAEDIEFKDMGATVAITETVNLEGLEITGSASASAFAEPDTISQKETA